jgi:phage terminase large subunit-like protein
VAAQMLQNPLAGKQNTFMPQWLRPWHVRPSIMNVYIMVDPSRGKSKSSDRTAMAVVGIDGAGNKYLLDGYRHRMSLSERWLNLRNLWLKWSAERGVTFVKVGYERYGQQTDDEYIKEKQRATGEVAQFELIELNWTREGNQSKKHRVERLEPDFKNGRFYLPGFIREQTVHPRTGVAGSFDCFWSINEKDSLIETTPINGLTKDMQALKDRGESHRIARAIFRKDEDGRTYDVTRALIEEMLFFPFAPKDDMVDAVSRIYDMEPTSAAFSEAREAEEINDRDWVDS